MDYEEWRNQKDEWKDDRQRWREERRERWRQNRMMWGGGQRHGWVARGMGPRFRGYGPPNALSGSASASGPIAASKIDEWAMFGGVKRRVESQEFEGGEAFVMFGGIEIDLRRAGTKLDEMRIDANAMF